MLEPIHAGQPRPKSKVIVSCCNHNQLTHGHELDDVAPVHRHQRVAAARVLAPEGGIWAPELRQWACWCPWQDSNLHLLFRR